jgi:hypothetical protein
MPSLTCPVCEREGEISGKGIYADSVDGAFERRGKVGRRPVFKCGECEAILIVRPRLFGVLGMDAHAVDDDTWVDMEVAWGSHQDALKNDQIFRNISESMERKRAQKEAAAKAEGRTVRCSHCDKFFATDSARDQHISAVHSGSPAT